MSTRAPRPVPVLAVALASVAGLGLTACGTSTIKAEQVAENLSKEYAARGVALTDVSCEVGAKAKVGEPLTCTALNPSKTKLTLKGKVTAIEDGKIKHQLFNAVSGVADGRVVAAELLRAAQAQIGTRARTLTCPDEVPIPTRTSVTCALVKSDGKTYDAKGSIDERSRFSLDVAARPR